MAAEIVIILDSERHIRWTLKHLLEAEGYRTLSADSVQKASYLFSEHQVACLMTEYWVDDGCTLGLIRSLKEKSPELYVMMLGSEEFGEREYERVLNAGVDDFFKKPFSAEKILLHLRKGLKQRVVWLEKKKLEQELGRIDLMRHTKEFPSKGGNVYL